jgi:hypothetical protein
MNPLGRLAQFGSLRPPSQQGRWASRAVRAYDGLLTIPQVIQRIGSTKVRIKLCTRGGYSPRAQTRQRLLFIRTSPPCGLTCNSADIDGRPAGIARSNELERAD